MKHREKKFTRAQAGKRQAFIERGINLDVPGTALIAQADERIKWHKRIASTMEAELASIKMKASETDKGAEWQTRARRTDLEKKISAHLEYASFLTFVRKSLVRNRRYRVGLSDMYSLELMPKGTYL